MALKKINTWIAMLPVLMLALMLALGISACTNIGASAKPETAVMCFDASLLNADEQRLADSLLTVALDNEALFTFVGPLKPMSTIATFYVEVARPDSTPRGGRTVPKQVAGDLVRVEKFQRIANAMRCDKVRFILQPFKMASGGKRAMDICAVRIDLFEKMLGRERSFWGQWGFTPETPPETVASVIEYEQKYDRYRGYGYLFGYPEHAVTFFVEAARSEDTAKKFVVRDFFQMPVASGREGHFVYAVPKGYTPQPEDLAVQQQAAKILAEYQVRRPRYLNADSTLRARQLLRDWYRDMKTSD